MADIQQGPEIKSTPYQNPMSNFGSSILYLTNPENELYKLELTFRSQVLDRDGNPQVLGEPLMNERGISSVLGQAQALINQVTIMSNLDKKEIPLMMDFLGDTLAKDLLANGHKYDLNPHDYDKVYFEVLATSFVCMKRATTEGLSDKKFWRGSVQEINTSVSQPKKAGILSKITGWGKN